MFPFVLLSLAVALYFFFAALQQPRPATIATAILWLLYAVYEYQIASGVLCDANCNIRVDLILAWPLLAITTLYASNTPGQRSVIKKILGVIAFIIFVLLVPPLVYVALVGFPADTESTPSPQPSPK